MSHRVTAEFDDFGIRQLQQAAHSQGVSIEELLAHAAMYYLADLESGRMATRVFPRGAPGSAPLQQAADD